MTEKQIPESLKKLLHKVGEHLKTTREKQNLTLEDVCESLKMQRNYARALEDGDYNSIPNPAAFFALLRSYAKALNLDPEAIIAECKKNNFLMSEYLGHAVIERNQNQLQIDETRLEEKLKKVKKDKAKPQDKTKSGETSKKDISKKGTLKKDTGQKTLLVCLNIVLIVLIGFGLAFYYRAELGIEEQFESLLEPLTSSSQCSRFVLRVKDQVDIKVQSLSLGENIINKSFFKGDEISFSDASGVKLMVSDPSSVVLSYKNQPVDWLSIQRVDGSYIYKCK